MLDDVWDSSVLKVFDIHCRILLTTRNRGLTDSVSGMHNIVSPAQKKVKGLIKSTWRYIVS